MKTSLIYDSKYGHTKKYAEWIGQELGLEATNIEDTKEDILKNTDLLIYGSPIYTGKVSGKEIISKLKADAKIVFFIVGSSDPNDTEHTEVYKKSLEESQIAKCKFFHLQAGFDYPNLSFVHKMMMKFIKPQFEKVPEHERSKDYQTMLDNYFTGYDNSSKESITPILDYVNTIK